MRNDDFCASYVWEILEKRLADAMADGEMRTWVIRDLPFLIEMYAGAKAADALGWAGDGWIAYVVGELRRFPVRQIDRNLIAKGNS